MRGLINKNHHMGECKIRVIYLPGRLPLDYTIQLVNSLSKNENVKSLLILFNTPKATPKVKEYLTYVCEKVEVYLTREKGSFLWSPTNLVIFIDVLKKINHFKPDIIHVQYPSGLPTFLILLFSKFFKKYRLISTIHDARPHIGYGNLLSLYMHSWILKNSKCIFVHGKQQKEIIIKEHNINENRITVIPMGEHNVKPFEKYLCAKPTYNSDKHIILFFGSITSYKGLEYLIKCEPLITKEVPDVKIIIAGGKGKGKYDTNYLKKCKEMIINKDSFLIYNHYIDWKLGAELFQKARVVVLPYIEATQSGVIPVAYAFKKPVVVTNVGALPEAVDNGKTGFVVPPKNPVALAEAIIKLLKDEKLRKEMGEAGYKKLKTDMSWDKISEMTIEAYKKWLLYLIV